MAREKAASNKSAKVKAAELLAQMGSQPSPIDEETRAVACRYGIVDAFDRDCQGRCHLYD